MGRQVRALFPEYNPAGREVALRRFPLDRMLRRKGVRRGSWIGALFSRIKKAML